MLRHGGHFHKIQTKWLQTHWTNMLCILHVQPDSAINNDITVQVWVREYQWLNVLHGLERYFRLAANILYMVTPLNSTMLSLLSWYFIHKYISFLIQIQEAYVAILIYSAIWLNNIWKERHKISRSSLFTNTVYKHKLGQWAIPFWV